MGGADGPEPLPAPQVGSGVLDVPRSPRGVGAPWASGLQPEDALSVWH